MKENKFLVGRRQLLVLSFNEFRYRILAGPSSLLQTRNGLRYHLQQTNANKQLRKLE